MEKTNYNKQKNQAFTYFRVSKNELPKLNTSQFTIYDFVRNSFSFAQERKELAIQILERIKTTPQTFPELQKQFNTPKSSLYLTLLALENSGLVYKQTSTNQYFISSDFSKVLTDYANWYSGWASGAQKPLD